MLRPRVKRVLFVMPPTFDAHLPHYRRRFELLAEHVECHVILVGRAEFRQKSFGRTTFYVQPLPSQNTLQAKLKAIWEVQKLAVDVARRIRADAVVAYDPLTLGVIGCGVKVLTGSPLIVEVNGHLRDARAASMADGRRNRARKLGFNAVCSSSLLLADAVKLLNREQFQEWRTILSRRPCFEFHNLVPTSLFAPGGTERDYILAVGYPFRLKGVDLLLAAYDRVRAEFPGVRLVIVGYCPEPELSGWRARVAAVPGAELRGAVEHDEIQELLQGALFLAHPSRTEAMGRIIVEAMACGKAVVGSRVGGIPNLIRDGVSGFLVRPEDSFDLAEKLRLLLSDSELRRRMGEEARRLSQSNLSEQRYVRAFMTMLETVWDPSGARPKTGIVYSTNEE